ncbi:MAG: PAS domain-containing protein, partial [Anaerolineales bacterium]
MLRFFFVDLLVGIFMFALVFLIRRGKIELAAHLSLNLITFGTLAFFQLDNLYAWASFLAIPVFVASFVLTPVFSILYATLATLGYSALYIFIRPDVPYPYIIILSFFIVAAISFLIASRYNKASRQVLQFDRQFQAIFNRVPVGLYRTSAKGKILEANPTLINMLGYEDLESLIKV